jgi:hypothetical protein
MGILGDIEGGAEAFVDGITGHSSTPHYAPVPTVDGAPPGPVEPHRWTAPDVGGSGQVTVHRDVLRKVASNMHSAVSDLDLAVANVKNTASSLGFSGWPTGEAFGGNVRNICTGFGQVGAHTSDTQSNAAKNLTDTASTYDEKEASITQSVNSGPMSTLNASSGSVSATSGNWS